MKIKSIIYISAVFLGSLSSSFTFADTPAINTTLAKQCVELFQKADNLVNEAKDQPGRHLQLSSIQSKLQDSKKEIAALGLDMQEMSCEKGLIAFNSLTE